MATATAVTIISLIVTLALINGSCGDVCSSRVKYDMNMLQKLTTYENEIRDTVRSLTESILFCSKEGKECTKEGKEESCPAGAYQNGNSCYFFSGDDATWPGAMERCIRDFGGYLAVIESEEENLFLQNIARTKGSKVELWIGGTGAFLDGVWRWVDTFKPMASSSYDDWRAGDGPDSRTGNEQCLEMKAVYGYHWNDDQCWNRQKFICEKKLE